MTWSYSGDPSASPLDALRFLIGDTNESDQQFSDQELLYLLSSADGSVSAAGLEASRRGIAKCVRCVDQRTGDIDIKYSQLRDWYLTLMDQIRAGDDMLPVPYAGGISKSDMESVQSDDDRQGPQFAIGQMDYPTDIPDPNGYGGTGGVL